MFASDWVATAANFVTAAGVLLVGLQLRLNRRQMVIAFERTFTDRYERIIRDVPLALLLGEDFDPSSDETALRAFFEYFELCEEEMHYRRVGKVSRSTWSAWWEGIMFDLRRRAFRRAWEYLSEMATARYQLLRQAIVAMDAGEPFDPRRLPRRD